MVGIGTVVIDPPEGNMKQYFESLVGVSPVAVVTMDRDEQVSGWNPAATALFGYPEEEAIGRRIDDLILRSDALRVEGEDRLLDIPTEIRYRAGGLVPAARVFLTDAGEPDRPSRWTLRLEPYDGTFTVIEGTVRDDG